MLILPYFCKYECRTLFFDSNARLRYKFGLRKDKTSRCNVFAADANQFIEGSNQNSSRSTRGQDLFDQRQPVALTADSDAERFLRARTNMFRRITLRMRTCNALRNTYASDNRRERTKLIILWVLDQNLCRIRISVLKD